MPSDQPPLNPAWPVLRAYRGEHLAACRHASRRHRHRHRLARRARKPPRLGDRQPPRQGLRPHGARDAQHDRAPRLLRRPRAGPGPTTCHATAGRRSRPGGFRGHARLARAPPRSAALRGRLVPRRLSAWRSYVCATRTCPSRSASKPSTRSSPAVPTTAACPSPSSAGWLPIRRTCPCESRFAPPWPTLSAPTDGTVEPKRNVNRWRVGNGLRGLDMRSDGVPADAEQWGTLALTVLDAPDQTVTARTAWHDIPWGDALLDFWDDFSADGELDDRPPGAADSPTASLAAAVDLDPGAERAVTFLLAWHFPNRLTWDVMRTGDDRADWVGNHYATRAPDAWTAAEAAAVRLPDLERDTVQFVRAFCAADIPDAIKEAALFNLSTLRSQTAFRSAEGGFYGFEGCFDDAGAGFGTCTHVWNYEHATAFLFGDLARGMREVEFNESTGSRRPHGIPRGAARADAPPTGDWPPPTASSAASSSSTATGSSAATRSSCVACGPTRAARWSSAGSRAAGTPTATASWRAASTTPWTSSTSAPTPRSAAGIWPRCERRKRWRPTSAKQNSPPSAAACSSTGAPGSTPTSSTATTTSTRSGRSPTVHASPPVCAGPKTLPPSALRLPSTRSAPAASSASLWVRPPPASAASARCSIPTTWPRRSAPSCATTFAPPCGAT